MLMSKAAALRLPATRPPKLLTDSALDLRVLAHQPETQKCILEESPPRMTGLPASALSMVAPVEHRTVLVVYTLD